VEDVQNYAVLLKQEGYALRPKDLPSPEIFGTKGAETYRYFCLPDTIDPRGPKGK
jgi:hypothetical protein